MISLDVWLVLGAGSMWPWAPRRNGDAWRWSRRLRRKCMIDPWWQKALLFRRIMDFLGDFLGDSE